MKLGVCYYPEHWPEETWKPDAKRMKDIGIHWVRVAEFAWSRLEPQDGKLNFDWLDRSVDTLGEAGLSVVMCTPTATPPKWLIDKYDDVLQVDVQGRPRKFGSRRHYCYNSASYREETRRITSVMAERYGKHEAVAAWQTDNEYGCHDTVRCYCPNCEREFRVWLEQKYGAIAALNEAWWNVFWSMEYNDFSQIDLPNLTTTEANPSHSLDFYRFASDSVISYNQLQCKLIREKSSYPVSHNVMLYFGDFDHFKFAKDLDIITWDNYPLGMLEQSPLPAEVKAHFLRTGHPDLISLIHDLYYGLKDQPFWVMEQQPGQVNWAPSNPIPAKGAVRLWSHQAFGHGADVVSYFRWRAANGAQELMHAGLNKHDGTPDRATTEARQVANELRMLGKKQTEVALLFDYENLWATELQKHAQGWSYWGLMFSYYHALRSLGLDVAIVHPRSDLSPYKLAVAPALHLVDEALAKHLESYVNQGGQLVIGPRSGFKTLSNVVQELAPGPLQNLMGLTVSHVDALRPGISDTILKGDETLSYSTWADLLRPTTAEVLASYTNPAYEGAAAVCQQAHGKGRCLTIGMWTEPEVLKVFLKPVLQSLTIAIQDLPEGVRLASREGRSYIYNFNPHEVKLELQDIKTTLNAFDLKFKDQ